MRGFSPTKNLHVIFGVVNGIRLEKSSLLEDELQVLCGVLLLLRLSPSKDSTPSYHPPNSHPSVSTG
jgi:hypothetical protein